MANTIWLGTTLSLNDGGGGSYVEVLNVVMIQPPGPRVIFTSADYWNIGHRILTFKPIRTDPGSSMVTVLYEGSERARFIVQQILTLNATAPSWRITYTDSVTHTWSAWVEHVGNVFTIGELNTVTLELKGNSLITVA